MITLFNKFKIKPDDLKIGDYVKIKETSPFYNFEKGWLDENPHRIYYIDRLDRISAYLKDINGNYPDAMFSEVVRRNLRKLTKSEKEELDIILATNKFNI